MILLYSNLSVSTPYFKLNLTVITFSFVPTHDSYRCLNIHGFNLLLAPCVSCDYPLLFGLFNFPVGSTLSIKAYALNLK
jgi:hypothetical protein